MRRHPDKECTGIRVFTETVGDQPEQRTASKKRGSLFSIYIFKNRNWVKIGEYCSTCGFHFDEEQLSKIFGNAKESTKITVEIEAGKRVPYVYSHEFPRRFDISLKSSQELPVYPLACTNPQGLVPAELLK